MLRCGLSERVYSDLREMKHTEVAENRSLSALFSYKDEWGVFAVLHRIAEMVLHLFSRTFSILVKGTTLTSSRDLEMFLLSSTFFEFFNAEKDILSPLLDILPVRFIDVESIHWNSHESSKGQSKAWIFLVEQFYPKMRLCFRQRVRPFLLWFHCGAFWPCHASQFCH